MFKWDTYALFLFFVILFSCVNNQAPEYIIIQNLNPNPGTIQLSDEVTIPKQSRGTTFVKPKNGENATGLLVFIQSDSAAIHSIVPKAINKNIAVLFVSTGNALDFLFDQDEVQWIDRQIFEIVSSHNLPPDRIFIAGMSLAGTRALKYAQFCNASPTQSQVKPRAIVICDSPLDFVRFWTTCQNAEELNFQPAASAEGKWVSAHLEQNLGGTPSDTLPAYLNYSVFVHGRNESSKLKLIENTAIRAYHEPDVNWWIDTRRKDYYSMNSIDAAALINQLKILGNSEAELISTHEKGVLPDGRRHPHSWSIVDEEELLDWLISLP